MTHIFIRAKFSVLALYFIFSTYTNAEDTQLIVPKDIIYHNAIIYTVNPLRPWAESLVVRNGKIVAVGSNEEIDNEIGNETIKIDLGGRFVLPGFHDSHVHPITGGLKTRGLFVHPESNADGVAKIIADYAYNNPNVKIIIAKGFGAQVVAHRTILDNVVSDRPVFIEGFGGHSVWLNSSALALAGINKNTVTPEGGAIIRDENTGDPTGLLIDSAAFLAHKVMPREKVGFTEKIEIGNEVLERMTTYGITSFKDAMVEEEILAVYNELEKKGELNHRIAAAILISGFGLDKDGEVKARKLLKSRHNYQTSLINPNFVKVFLDGVPPAMALLDPPPSIKEPMTRPFVKRPQLDKLVSELDTAGVSVMVHAHGDAAIREFLDAVENTRRHNGKGVTHHIAHCSTIRHDDALRLRFLGVVCEMSPYIWFPSEGMKAASAILGEALIRRAYAAGTVVAAGGSLAAGSDWAYDNLDLNPLPYLEALVSRKDPFGRTPGQFNPDQALSVAQAIKTFTLNGAIAMGTEKETGSIEKGKLADFIVLDKNLFNIPVDSISDVNVDLTIFDGRVIFRREK
jgi:predicted amidohydrolase YtcJ